MWQPKTIAVPLIVGALGIIKKRVQMNIFLKIGIPRQYEIPKKSLCGIAHLLRRVLSK